MTTYEISLSPEIILEALRISLIFMAVYIALLYWLSRNNKALGEMVSKGVNVVLAVFAWLQLFVEAISTTLGITGYFDVGELFILAVIFATVTVIHSFMDFSEAD